MREIITDRTLERLGTLTHNQTFERREWLSYGGTLAEFRALVRVRLIMYTIDRGDPHAPRGWFLTRAGRARLEALLARFSDSSDY